MGMEILRKKLKLRIKRVILIISKLKKYDIFFNNYLDIKYSHIINSKSEQSH